MRKITRQSLDELAKVMPVLSEREQEEFIGGGTSAFNPSTGYVGLTGNGFYDEAIFFTGAPAPSSVGSGTGFVGSGTGFVGSGSGMNATWYTEEEYESMSASGTWTGGYVSGYDSYVMETLEVEGKKNDESDDEDDDEDDSMWDGYGGSTWPPMNIPSDSTVVSSSTGGGGSAGGGSYLGGGGNVSGGGSVGLISLKSSYNTLINALKKNSAINVIGDISEYCLSSKQKELLKNIEGGSSIIYGNLPGMVGGRWDRRENQMILDSGFLGNIWDNGAVNHGNLALTICTMIHELNHALQDDNKESISNRMITELPAYVMTDIKSCQLTQVLKDLNPAEYSGMGLTVDDTTALTGAGEAIQEKYKDFLSTVTQGGTFHADYFKAHIGEFYGGFVDSLNSKYPNAPLTDAEKKAGMNHNYDWDKYIQFNGF